MGVKGFFDRVKLWLERDPELHTPADAHAEFTLVYGSLPIGTLAVQDGEWAFRYTDEFRRQSKLRPLVEFPEVSVTYRSTELWPFFAMRIPSLKQTSVQDILRQEEIDASDEVELLRRFGRRTVANPFELVEPRSPETMSHRNGRRVQLPGQSDIYLIDEGRKRHIPNESTYDRLFRSWIGIEQDPNINEIKSGPPIPDGASLAQAEGDAAVYFIDGSVKRHVMSPERMDQYHFRWPTARVAPAVLNAIPTGRPI